MPKARKQDASKKKNQAEIYHFAKQGASIHQLLLKFPSLTVAEAQNAIREVAEDNKTAGPAHRANLRNAIREQGMIAIGMIANIAKDSAVSVEVRLKAATEILKHSVHFSDETVMRSWQERPDTSVTLQPTLFDFGPIIDEDGGIGFRGETVPMLQLVPPENEDE